MTVKRDGNGQIQRSNGNGGSNLASFLANELGPQIKMALPKHLDADRMARVALTALRTTPKLMECDKWSFAACILQSAQLGLEVNTPLGHAYLIPRKGQCTLQLGYQGMIELARRSGQVASIYAYTVHQGDDFRYEYGLNPTVHHVPNVDAEQSERTMTFVYAVAALRGGDHDRQFEVLSKRKVDERKARGAGGPAWRTDYLAMARKTAVRSLFTWLPKSPEMARAVSVDADEAHAPLSRTLDASVVEALDTMQLPPPPEDEAPALTSGEDEPSDA
jgi:recombination protein RecT